MRVNKKALLAFIRSRDVVTFEDVETFFKEKRYDFRGDTELMFLQSKRLAWNGWSHRAARIFQELVKDGKIQLCEASPSEAPAPPDCNRVYIPIFIKAV